MPEYKAQQSMFEGLYHRVLKPTGAFREDLKSAGYDFDLPNPTYPIEVWRDCLDVTWKHKFSTLERYAAWQAIGRIFIEGFLETLVGKLISVTFPFLSAKAFMARAPRFISSGIVGATVALDWKGDDEVHVLMTGPHPGASYVTAGVVEVCLKRLGVEPHVTASLLEGDQSRLVVSWRKD